MMSKTHFIEESDCHFIEPHVRGMSLRAFRGKAYREPIAGRGMTNDVTSLAPQQVRQVRAPPDGSADIETVQRTS